MPMNTDLDQLSETNETFIESAKIKNLTSGYCKLIEALTILSSVEENDNGFIKFQLDRIAEVFALEINKAKRALLKSTSKAS